MILAKINSNCEKKGHNKTGHIVEVRRKSVNNRYWVAYPGQKKEFIINRTWFDLIKNEEK